VRHDYFDRSSATPPNVMRIAVPVANRRPLDLSALAGVAGPQGGVESVFESGECGGVGPCVAVDDARQDAVRDAGAAGDGADAVLVGDGLDVDGEQARLFRDVVFALDFGPRAGEGSGGFAGWARHASIIRTDPNRPVHSRNNLVTPSRQNGARKHQSGKGQATVGGRIGNYTPNIELEHWANIEDFVRSAVTRAVPSTTYGASKLFSAVTPFVHWAWKAGHHLDDVTIFDRWLIEEFIATACPTTWSQATKGNQRSVIFRVAEAVLGMDARTPRVLPLTAADPSRPYTAAEIVALRSWARSQSTELLRLNATVLLAFCAGAGLAAEDIAGVRVRDVRLHDDGSVTVLVPGRRGRRVTVLASWEGDAAACVVGRDPGEFVLVPGRTDGVFKNVCTQFVSRTTGVIKPSSQRLRATWLVHHLTIGTPVKVLLEAAGIGSLNALTRYVQFVPDVDVTVARRRLRDELRR